MIFLGMKLKNLLDRLKHVSIGNKMQEIMLDIETLSTSTNSVIVSIGAIKFDKTAKILPSVDLMDTFYRKIDINSCTNLGMEINKSTMDWWHKQDPVYTREALYSENNRVPIKQALIELSQWIKPCEKVWANSPDFDCTILKNAYHLCKLDLPWSYWNTRDVRTTVALAEISLKDISVATHNPVDDCYRQIIGLRKAFTLLGIHNYRS